MTKIAIIEDEKPIQEMYRLKFESEGYDVQTADDGNAGLDLIKKFDPDVILLDVMMPNMTGMEVMEHLGRLKEFDEKKIIILTNMDDVTTAKAMTDMGASDYIVKANMTPKQVAERVKQLLG